MHDTHSTEEALRFIVERARQQLSVSDRAAKTILGEMWRIIATHITPNVINPFARIDWHSFDMGIVLRAWRDGIKEWQDAGFQGMTPGQIAISAALDDVANDFGPLFEHDFGECRFLDGDTAEYIRAACLDVFGAAGKSIAEQVILQDLPDLIQQIQYAEAMALGVPHGVYTEFCWVPGWNGESLDELLDEFTVPTSLIHRGIEDLVSNNGLANFLTWANVSTLQLVDAALVRNEGQGEKLRERLHGFEVRKDYCRPQMLTPEEVIDIIENSTSNSVPVIHCEIEVGALLKLDPRQAFALPMRGGRMHVGLHDFFSGAGYMDSYLGTPVVPGMALGFAWPGRWSHGIDAVYGIVKHPFHCRPQAVEAPQRELLAA